MATYNLTTNISVKTSTGPFITYGSGVVFGGGDTYLQSLGVTLNVTRPLTSSIAVTSATSSPSLAVTRPLSTSISVVTSVGPFITYGSGILFGGGDTYLQSLGVTLAVTRTLATAIQVASAVGSPALAITRPLTTSIAVQSAVSAPVLADYRALTTSILIQSAVSSPALALTRRLSTTISVQSSTSDSVKLNFSLVTNIAVQSATSSPALSVTRRLITAIQIASMVSSPDLTVGTTLPGKVIYVDFKEKRMVMPLEDATLYLGAELEEIDYG